MKKLAIIIAILMAASSMSACSQAEKENYIHQKPTYSATADEAESRINTDIFGTETSETENAEKSPVSAFQEPSCVYPTSPNKAGVGQTSRRQGSVSDNDGSMQNSESSVTQISGSSASGLSIRQHIPSITSPKLWGGISVAIPKAIPEEPFTKSCGKRTGNTDGSFLLSSKFGTKSTVSFSISSNILRDRRFILASV